MRSRSVTDVRDMAARDRPGWLSYALVIVALLSCVFGSSATVHHVGDELKSESPHRIFASWLSALSDHHDHADMIVAGELAAETPHSELPAHPDHVVVLTELFLSCAVTFSIVTALFGAMIAIAWSLLRTLQASVLTRPRFEFLASGDSFLSLIARLLRTNHALLN